MPLTNAAADMSPRRGGLLVLGKLSRDGADELVKLCGGRNVEAAEQYPAVPEKLGLDHFFVPPGP